MEAIKSFATSSRAAPRHPGRRRQTDNVDLPAQKLEQSLQHGKKGSYPKAVFSGAESETRYRGLGVDPLGTNVYYDDNVEDYFCLPFSPFISS